MEQGGRMAQLADMSTHASLANLPHEILSRIFRKLGEYPCKEVVRMMSLSRDCRKAGAEDPELWCELRFDRVPRIRESDVLLTISRSQSRPHACSFANCEFISDQVLHALCASHNLSSLHAGNAKFTGAAIIQLLISLQHMRKMYPLPPFETSHIELIPEPHLQLNGMGIHGSAQLGIHSALSPISSPTCHSLNGTSTVELSEGNSLDPIHSTALQENTLCHALETDAMAPVDSSSSSSSSASPSPFHNSQEASSRFFISSQSARPLEGVDTDQHSWEIARGDLVLARVHFQKRKHSHYKKRSSEEIHELHRLQLQLLQDQMETGVYTQNVEDDLVESLLPYDEEDEDVIWQEIEEDSEEDGVGEENNNYGNCNDLGHVSMCDTINNSERKIEGENFFNSDLEWSCDRMNNKATSTAVANDSLNHIEDNCKIVHQLSNPDPIENSDDNAPSDIVEAFVPSVDQLRSQKVHKNSSTSYALNRLWLNGCDNVTKSQFEKIRSLVRWVDVSVCQDCFSVCTVDNCQMCDSSYCAPCRNVLECCVCKIKSCSRLSCVKSVFCEVCKSSYCQNCRKSWECEKCCKSFCENHINATRICYFPFHYCDVCFEELKVSSFFWSCIGCM